MFLMAMAALAAAPAAAAGPAPGSTDFDVQCMVVMQQAVDRVEESKKAALTGVAMFYFGRVDAAVSGEALKPHLRSIAQRLEGQQLGPMVQSCGEYMSTRSAALQKTGEALEAEGKPAK